MQKAWQGQQFGPLSAVCREWLGVPRSYGLFRIFVPLQEILFLRIRVTGKVVVREGQVARLAAVWGVRQAAVWGGAGD